MPRRLRADQESYFIVPDTRGAFRNSHALFVPTGEAMSSQPDDLFTRLSAAENDSAGLVPILGEIAELSLSPETFEFTHSIEMIGQSPALSSSALEVWLGGTTLHAGAAGALLRHLNVVHLTGEQLMTFEPGRQGADEAVLTGYRLAAFDAAPAVVLGWIVACLQADVEPGGERLLALLGYQTRQYPRTVARLLGPLDAGLIEKYPALGEMRQACEAANAERDAAPRLKELRLSIADREILRRYKLREQPDIHRQAEEASVLMQFITQSHFKYAREVALQFNADGVTAEHPLVMEEHEMTMELPFLAMTDPLGLLLRRRKLLKGQAP